ncbi:MAG: DNA polymerase III subunit beta, partial [Lachnospiraceae bacterium]|nr:DNA polymerase III subunit beta [Lachnospiraceae bacterium]
MKIKCKRSNLMKSLNIVSKAVSTKTTMPILECILIDVYADCIKLVANDLELGIETTLEG